MKPYKHFTMEERESLYLLLKLNKKVTEIAKELGRDKSTISREIRRNRNKQTKKYNSWGAHTKAIVRKRKFKGKYRIVPETELYNYICEGLQKYWSPEIISKKWNEKHPDDRISFSTIYSAIKRGVFEGITVKTHLRRRGKSRRKDRSKYNTIHPEHTIHDRPAIIDQRSRYGDWEGDTIRGANGKGCLVTFVDRKSRKLLAAKSDNMSSESVYKAVLKAFEGVKPLSITFDNGSEFALFKKMEEELNTTVYFADPHSPWQRGSNENINDVLRFFFPKGFDFKNLSDDYLEFVIDLINNRPRLCLNLLSPNDLFCCT